jgi:thioredoxin domain-containing protein 5
MKTYSISNILVLIFWTFLIFLFLNELFAKQNDTSKNTNETFKNIQENKITVYNFNTTWCGHSKNFQPVWDKFVESISTTDNVTAIDAKCDTNINDKLVKKYDVEGFPTVIIDQGNTFIKYSGERSVNGLRKALNLPVISDNMVAGTQHHCGGPHQKPNEGKTKIFNFNTSWCGYSVRFQPIWDQFSNQVNDPSVEVLDVKCDSDENAELCKKYDVPGYPSVLKVNPSGEVINYNGPRTVEGLLDFIKN